MRAKTEIKKTSNAVAILDRMAGESPELRRLTEEARINAAVKYSIPCGMILSQIGAGRTDAHGLEIPGTCRTFVS
jgi:hypothetical protein